jgi:tRNA(fMet)-specific endonuclease VapC
VSSPRFLLDTNICIFIRRRRPDHVLARFRRLRIGEACISAITFGELSFGANKSERRDRALAELSEFASLVPVLPLPIEAATRYGVVRAALSKAGSIIGSNDLWIASHALALNLTVVTNNVSEFCRVEGLRIEDWTVAR